MEGDSICREYLSSLKFPIHHGSRKAAFLRINKLRPAMQIATCLLIKPLEILLTTQTLIVIIIFSTLGRKLLILYLMSGGARCQRGLVSNCYELEGLWQFVFGSELHFVVLAAFTH